MFKPTPRASSYLEKRQKKTKRRIRPLDLSSSAKIPKYSYRKIEPVTIPKSSKSGSFQVSLPLFYGTKQWKNDKEKAAENEALLTDGLSRFRVSLSPSLSRMLDIQGSFTSQPDKAKSKDETPLAHSLDSSKPIADRSPSFSDISALLRTKQWYSSMISKSQLSEEPKHEDSRDFTEKDKDLSKDIDKEEEKEDSGVKFFESTLGSSHIVPKMKDVLVQPESFSIQTNTALLGHKIPPYVDTFETNSAAEASISDDDVSADDFLKSDNLTAISSLKREKKDLFDMYREESSSNEDDLKKYEQEKASPRDMIDRDSENNTHEAKELSSKDDYSADESSTQRHMAVMLPSSSSPLVKVPEVLTTSELVIPLVSHQPKIDSQLPEFPQDAKKDLSQSSIFSHDRFAMIDSLSSITVKLDHTLSALKMKDHRCTGPNTQDGSIISGYDDSIIGSEKNVFSTVSDTTLTVSEQVKEERKKEEEDLLRRQREDEERRKEEERRMEEQRIEEERRREEERRMEEERIREEERRREEEIIMMRREKERER
ncbi:hypothetical protein ADUPG1_008846, partial [Aduncisulcus paluster]